MAINSMQEQFMHDVGDIYDAEHRFLEAQQEMLEQASERYLQEALADHIDQTRQQIANLDEVYRLLNASPERVRCDAAAGLVAEGQKGMRDAGNELVRDVAIAVAGDKVEHYEIASYEGLITGAEVMKLGDVIALLRRNLDQEVTTSRTLQQQAPRLVERAYRPTERTR